MRRVCSVECPMTGTDSHSNWTCVGAVSRLDVQWDPCIKVASVMQINSSAPQTYTTRSSASMLALQKLCLFVGLSVVAAAAAPLTIPINPIPGPVHCVFCSSSKLKPSNTNPRIIVTSIQSPSFLQQRSLSSVIPLSPPPSVTPTVQHLSRTSSKSHIFHLYWTVSPVLKTSSKVTENVGT